MPQSFSVSIDRNVAIPMRDGIILFADVYRPATPGRYPVLLQRTPYDKSAALNNAAAFAIRAAGQGFALVCQDTRGRFASEGQFEAFLFEQQDGYDTCAWIQEQSWSNGRIGMFGASYVGLTQWQAALAGAPGLEAIVPNVTASDYHEGWTYQGGAFELSFNLNWTMAILATNTATRRVDHDPSYQPELDALLDRIDHFDKEFDRMPLAGDPTVADLAPYYETWLAHPENDAYWQNLRVEDRYADLDVKALNVGSWYDIFLGGTLRNYQGMRTQSKTAESREGSRLLIGPWDHMTIVTISPIGDYDPGVRASHAAIDLDGIQLRWYDRWLRDNDNGVDKEPPVTLFVMGANTWRQEQEWPLARTRYVDYHLASDGNANSLHGDGTLELEPPSGSANRPDQYLYDPLNPVPTSGGNLCCNTYWARPGSFDQRCIESRPDVLVYTSPPLEEAVEVTGPITVTLFAASTAVDTDFTAKLVDVFPDGYARNLTDGIIRARYRSSTATAELLEPGSIEQYEIDLWATSNLFQPGHRIRVEISSSNFPRFDRNPNHGGTIATATREDCLIAHQTIYHSADYPSRITLPLITGDLP